MNGFYRLDEGQRKQFLVLLVIFTLITLQGLTGGSILAGIVSLIVFNIAIRVLTNMNLFNENPLVAIVIVILVLVGFEVATSLLARLMPVMLRYTVNRILSLVFTAFVAYLWYAFYCMKKKG